MTERDEQGRFTTSNQPDIISLITQAYEQRQEEQAAAPLTEEELRLVDKVAEEVIAEDAKQQYIQQQADFLSSIFYPEGESDDAVD
jgi:hypothetical protein